jgi:hypothetical protein
VNLPTLSKACFTRMSITVWHLRRKRKEIEEFNKKVEKFFRKWH